MARNEEMVLYKIHTIYFSCKAVVMWKDQDAQEGGELGFSKNLSNL